MRKAITLNLVAGGNILPQTFVKLDPSNGLQCLQCGAGDKPIGVSGNWTRYAGGTPADDGYEAVNTEFPEVNGAGCVVPLVCGSTWACGDNLKPDAAGKGTPTTSAADSFGAIALEAANTGETGRVYVTFPNSGGALYTTLNALSANTTLTAANSGQLIVVTGTSKTITLPAGVAGMRFRMINLTTGSGNILHVPTGDTLNGQLVIGTELTPASGKGAVNTSGTAKIGDSVEVVCTSANTWYVLGVPAGVWARES